MATTNKESEKGTEEEPKKSKKKLIMIVAIVLVLVGGGGGAYYFFVASKDKAVPEPVAGIVVPLEPITVNLADGHYLKISIALQATTAAGEEPPDGSKALDLVISDFSNLTVAHLSTNETREAAKEKLSKQIEKAYVSKELDGQTTVMGIYFTEFVIQ
jgi:flagellar FliL protein